MKLYVHFEDTEVSTIICSVDEASTLQNLVEIFTERAQSKIGKKLNPSELKVENSLRKTLPLKKRIRRVLHDMEDVFISKETGEPIAKAPQPVSKPVASAAPSKPKAKPIPYDLSILASEMVRGEKEEAAGSFRSASNYYESALSKHPTYKRALVHLMNLWAKVKRPDVAEKWCDTALSHHSDDLSVLVAAGKIKGGCENYERAIQIFNKAVELAKKKPSKDFPLQDLQILAANAMYKLGGTWENPAVQLVMGVVEPERTHFDGLLLYAKIALDRGLAEDAVRVLLRLIMQQHEHEDVKRYLADCFEKPGMVHFVANELKEGSGLGSAFAFIAARIKDYGAVNSAIELYEKALEVDPDDPSIALNYMHTLELVSKTDRIVEFAMSFLNRSKLKLIRNLNPKEIGRVLRDLPKIENGKLLGWRQMEAWKPHELMEEIEEIVETVEYSESQLDLLALFFTVVKVLYVGGALERAYQAVQLIKPCCKASAKKLHMTTVRNEAAYFNCIRQILEEFPPQEITDDQIQPLYICGDSHCLSSAWQILQYKGENRLLLPKLVTGCKVWHLRDESRFYPKIAFQNTIQSIPKRQSVLLNFGEIDCRTGIGLAVEKCKYDSQEQAIKTTVSIYVRTIKQLIKNHQFEISVHPVPPALDLTRPMVIAYNQVLKESILEWSKHKNYKGKLFLLDFLDDLVMPGGRVLKPELRFDDTHLSPTYTQYLQQALTKCDPGSRS